MVWHLGLKEGPWSDSFVKAVLAYPYSITIGLSASTGKRLKEVGYVERLRKPIPPEGSFPFNLPAPIRTPLMGMDKTESTAMILYFKARK
jgi:hypothetical protein